MWTQSSHCHHRPPFSFMVSWKHLIRAVLPQNIKCWGYWENKKKLHAFKIHIQYEIVFTSSIQQMLRLKISSALGSPYAPVPQEIQRNTFLELLPVVMCERRGHALYTDIRSCACWSHRGGKTEKKMPPSTKLACKMTSRPRRRVKIKLGQNNSEVKSLRW